MNWASQRDNVELSVHAAFKQAYDFCAATRPDKAAGAGWLGAVLSVTSSIFTDHVPEDVIYVLPSAISFGWDPVHEAFGKLGDRERWPIPWIEDDPSMWFPQIHASRFERTWP